MCYTQVNVFLGGFIGVPALALLKCLSSEMEKKDFIQTLGLHT